MSVSPYLHLYNLADFAQQVWKFKRATAQILGPSVAKLLLWSEMGCRKMTDRFIVMTTGIWWDGTLRTPAWADKVMFCGTVGCVISCCVVVFCCLCQESCSVSPCWWSQSRWWWRLSSPTSSCAKTPASEFLRRLDVFFYTAVTDLVLRVRPTAQSLLHVPDTHRQTDTQTKIQMSQSVWKNLTCPTGRPAVLHVPDSLSQTDRQTDRQTDSLTVTDLVCLRRSASRWHHRLRLRSSVLRWSSASRRTTTWRQSGTVRRIWTACRSSASWNNTTAGRRRRPWWGRTAVDAATRCRLAAAVRPTPATVDGRGRRRHITRTRRRQTTPSCTRASGRCSPRSSTESSSGCSSAPALAHSAPCSPRCRIKTSREHFTR